MELILIRHGQPDYSEVTVRKYTGHGCELTELVTILARQWRRDWPEIISC